MLVMVTAYTSSTDPWTTEEAADHAAHLLRLSLPGIEEDFVVASILKGYLRPLFIKTNAKVTPTGRPAQFRNHQHHQEQQQDRPNWKTKVPPVLPTIRWAVEVADVSSTILLNFTTRRAAALTTVLGKSHPGELAALYTCSSHDDRG
jgi:hypothetical protein